MKKIVVLGATGMAGHMVFDYLHSLNKYDLFSICYRKKFNENSYIVDIYNSVDLFQILTDIQPDYVINCIGILVNGAKNSPQNAIYVNAYFPHLLSSFLNSNISNAQLIHISTDCVFSGISGYYKDTDIKDALDVYGMTKNLGEIINEKDLTIRTSIIGPELKGNGEGLFHWLFKQKNNKQVTGYEKSIWGGITTLELAKVIDYLITNKITGLFQVSNNDKISKYNLLKLIIDQFNLPIQLLSVPGVVSDKSIQLSKRENFSLIIPTYYKMVKELYDYMKKDSEKYLFYFN